MCVFLIDICMSIQKNIYWKSDGLQANANKREKNYSFSSPSPIKSLILFIIVGKVCISRHFLFFFGLNERENSINNLCNLIKKVINFRVIWFENCGWLGCFVLLKSSTILIGKIIVLNQSIMKR